MDDETDRTQPSRWHTSPLGVGMSRRDALGTSASLVVGAALGALQTRCRSTTADDAAGGDRAGADPAPALAGPGEAPAPGFSADQRAILEDMADFLIPETNSPGARSAGVLAFIEDMVLEVYDESDRQGFGAGLSQVEAEALARYGQSFARCAPDARLELVRALLASARPVDEPARADSTTFFVRSVRLLTIQGFCRSRLGATRVLQYDPIPGAYDGCRSLESVGRAWATS